MRRFLISLLALTALAAPMALARVQAQPASEIIINGRRVSPRDFSAAYSQRQMLNTWGRDYVNVEAPGRLFYIYAVGPNSFLFFEFTPPDSLARVTYIAASGQPQYPQRLFGGPTEQEAQRKIGDVLSRARPTFPDVIKAWGLPTYTQGGRTEAQPRHWFYEFADGACADVDFMTTAPLTARVTPCGPDELRARPAR